MSKRVIHAEAAEETHAASMASAASIGGTIFIVLKYLGTFAEMLSGVLAGHLDQTIRGIKLGGKKWKFEIIASEDTGA
jgi:hypothetical protein